MSLEHVPHITPDPAMLITFLEEWKVEKENGAVYQIPTVELLLEELNEQYGTDTEEPEKATRDSE